MRSVNSLLPGLFLVLAVLARPSAAMADDDCLSKDRKHDLCQFADSIAKSMAPSLPKALNSELTIRAMAAIGKRLITYAEWPATKAQVDAYVLSLGVSQSQYDQGLLQVTKRIVCDPKGMLEFIQQGGEIEYQYRTVDAFPEASALVTECP